MCVLSAASGYTDHIIQDIYLLVFGVADPVTVDITGHVNAAVADCLLYIMQAFSFRD